MENKKKHGTIKILQGSRFGNSNKETETPLDRPHRENGRKQNTNQSHTQKSRRTGRPRKRLVEDVEEDLGKMRRQGLAKESKGEKRMGGRH
jgi:hypothetical protein